MAVSGLMVWIPVSIGEELQSLIGFLPQEFGTYENMTSWEFLDYQAILKGIIDEDFVRNG